MTIHEMKLSDGPFEAIKGRSKTIESRLYDEKRKKIKVGDEIIFSKNDRSENIKTEVISLNIYPDFKSLFNSFHVQKFGGENIGFLLNQVSEFYSEDDQAKWGVVGIEIKVKKIKEPSGSMC